MSNERLLTTTVQMRMVEKDNLLKKSDAERNLVKPRYDYTIERIVSYRLCTWN